MHGRCAGVRSGHEAHAAGGEHCAGFDDQFGCLADGAVGGLQDIAVVAAQGIRRAGGEARNTLTEIEAVGTVVFICAAGQDQFAFALFGEDACTGPIYGAGQCQVCAAQIKDAVGLHVERVGVCRAAAASHKGGAAREGQRAGSQNIQRGDRQGTAVNAHAAGEGVCCGKMQSAGIAFNDAA